MQVISPRSLGDETQELKEAICDAVANLTTDRVSGNGPTGEIVYGRSPRRAFVAGLLLPRFDQQGDDDTSDIRVSTLGIDLHILSNATDTAELRPFFATYIRVLPTWQELNDPRYGLELDFRLDPALELQIKNSIIAERRRIFAEEGLNRLDPKEMPLEERRQRKARRDAIRSEVTQKAYSDQGIELTTDDAAAVVAAVSGIDSSAASAAEAASTAAAGESNPNQPSSEAEGADTVPISMLQRRGRRVPVARLLPADIPSKWRRLSLPLPTFSWSLSSTGTDLRRDVDRFSAEMRAAAMATVRAWLLSPEGLDQAWRDVQVMPADSITEDSWNAFLQRVRSAAPQPDQLMPEFSGLRVGVDKMPNYADPSISSLRVTLENDNQELSGRAARRRTETIFQARLELRTSQRAHRALTLDRVEPSYRFRDHLNYPAMGLNCGVTASEEAHSKILATTWAPRFVQPRIIARAIDMPLTFVALADPNKAMDELLLLPRQYRSWIAENEADLRVEVRRGLARSSPRAEQDFVAASIG